MVKYDAEYISSQDDQDLDDAPGIGNDRIASADGCQDFGQRLSAFGDQIVEPVDEGHEDVGIEDLDEPSSQEAFMVVLFLHVLLHQSVTAQKEEDTDAI